MSFAMAGAELTIFNIRRALVAATFAAAMLVEPLAAEAQVVVTVNGMPITEYDIQQRSKLIATSTHKKPANQEVLNELIDDRLKITRAKFYGMEVSDEEINNAFDNMAKRQRATSEQFSQFLARIGIAASTVKARIRAEITWQQLIRGKFGPSLQINESDINSALRERTEDTKDAVGYIYTLYPVMVVVPRGSSAATIEAKRREAENLRSRFTNCSQGLALARALRDIAVREPITRSSSDLTPELRELLAKLEIGKLTTPDVTAQGLQMFAVCNKKQSIQESPLKAEVRSQLYAKKFAAESKRYLDEIRRQAMIEYKK
jgi:peptidyl-prolyl cis-trans isomerase SurA